MHVHWIKLQTYEAQMDNFPCPFSGCMSHFLILTLAPFNGCMSHFLILTLLHPSAFCSPSLPAWSVFCCLVLHRGAVCCPVRCHQQMVQSLGCTRSGRDFFVPHCLWCRPPDCLPCINHFFSW